jgi:hypothetical protein
MQNFMAAMAQVQPPEDDEYEYEVRKCRQRRGRGRLSDPSLAAPSLTRSCATLLVGIRGRRGGKLRGTER